MGAFAGWMAAFAVTGAVGPSEDAQVIPSGVQDVDVFGPSEGTVAAAYTSAVGAGVTWSRASGVTASAWFFRDGPDVPLAAVEPAQPIQGGNTNLGPRFGLGCQVTVPFAARVDDTDPV